MKYETTKEALAAIYKQFGADVLLGKINAYLSDFAPSVPENFKRLVYAVHTFGASKVLKDNLNETQENKEAAVKIAVRCLTDAFISRKIAEDVIFEFVDALGWKIERPVVNPPQPVQPPVQPQPKQVQPQTNQAQPQIKQVQPKIQPVPQQKPAPQPQKPQPIPKPQPAPTPRPAPRSKPKRSFRLLAFFKSIFTIVDFDSGDGSELFFGIIGAAIGLGIGSLAGGIFGAIGGGIVGYILFSVFIGKRIHVNLGKIILVVIIASIAISVITTGVIYIMAFFKSHTSVTKAAVITRTATVITDALNMYEEASSDSEVIKTIRRGDTVTVLGETENGWANIKHGSDSGYAGAEYLLITGERQPETRAASLINGTHTFWPRLQASRDSQLVNDIFIPQIIVTNNTIVIYTCSNKSGIYRHAASETNWDIDWDPGIDGFYNSRNFTLQDLDNPSRTLQPVQALSTDNGMGKIWSLTFNNPGSARLQLTGKQYSGDAQPFVFEEIIMGDAD